MAAAILPTTLLMTVSTTVSMPVPMAVPQTISTASIGIPDTFFLMLLALVVFGPRRLPEIGRQIGKLMYEFRKVSNDFKFQMEEELRASEEADRIRKLEAVQSLQPAVDVARLDIPPHPVSETQPLEITSGSEASSETGSEAISAEANPGEVAVPALEGEVRAEAPTYPGIQPPATGETIAAQKPFRHRVSEPATEPTTESGDPANHEVSQPLIIADEGRVGTEVQPGMETSPRVEAASPETSPETNPETSTSASAAQAVHHG